MISDDDPNDVRFEPRLGLPVRSVDSGSELVFVRVPRENVVIFQGIFECYEGLAVVRTLDQDSSVIGVMTTPENLDDTISALESLRQQIGWTHPEWIPEDLKLLE